MPLKAGDWIEGRYRIIRSLGKGSEGSVYLAVQESVYKFYAVKVLEKHGVCFSKESIELWKRLSHPGLPEIADIIEKDTEVYLIMDYVEGMALNEAVDLKGIPSAGSVMKWGIDICEILEYLHGQNPPIIFGDLKPSNLVLQKDRVVLVDFGSAAMLCSRGPRCGTEEYFPPWKQKGMEAADVATDIYGLGKTLEFAASGGSDHRAVPKELRKILDSCTSPQDSVRYREVKECRLALERLRNRCWLRLAMALLSVCVAVTAGRTVRTENGAANAAVQYQELLAQAKRGTPGEAKGLLTEAICLEPAKVEAYLALLEHFLEDACLSEEEDVCLRTVLREGREDGVCNEQRLGENEEGYAQVCYEIGMAYWYFYEGEGGKTYAGSWFQRVLEAPETVCLDQRCRTRSRIYAKIGSYRARLVQGGRSGEKTVSYREYWEDLMELLGIPTEELDSVVTSLHIWKEILLQMSHYIWEFQSEGITEAQMRSVLENIRGKTERTEEEGKAVLEQKKEIGKMMEALEETLDGIR